VTVDEDASQKRPVNVQLLIAMKSDRDAELATPAFERHRRTYRECPRHRASAGPLVKALSPVTATRASGMKGDRYVVRQWITGVGLEGVVQPHAQRRRDRARAGGAYWPDRACPGVCGRGPACGARTSERHHRGRRHPRRPSPASGLGDQPRPVRRHPLARHRPLPRPLGPAAAPMNLRRGRRAPAESYVVGNFRGYSAPAGMRSLSGGLISHLLISA
jgi:hypothetical protein